MKILTIILLIISCAIIAFHFDIKSLPDEEEIDKYLKIYDVSGKDVKGRIAPNFQVQLLNGRKVSMADQIGKKIIIVNFMASWCEACKSELPELEKFYVKYKDKGLFLLGVSLDDEEDRKELRNVLKEKEVTFPVGFLREGRKSLLRELDIKHIPVTYLVGINGKVMFYRKGVISNADVAFEKLVKANLKGLENGKGITREQYLARLQAQIEGTLSEVE